MKILTTNVSAINEDCSNEALRFIAGYIAFKVHDKNLGINTASAPTDHYKINYTLWIETLSRGGLILPNEKWFIQFHGENSFNMGKSNQIIFGITNTSFSSKEYISFETFCENKNFFSELNT